jgi:hypothetical protein
MTHSFQVGGPALDEVRREHGSRGEIAQLHSRRAGIGEGGLKHWTLVKMACDFGLVRSVGLASNQILAAKTQLFLDYPAARLKAEHL